jgi:hypothetical protein
MTDSGLMVATSIVLFSTGHWIGGTVAVGLAFIAALGEKR